MARLTVGAALAIEEREVSVGMDVKLNQGGGCFRDSKQEQGISISTIADGEWRFNFGHDPDSKTTECVLTTPNAVTHLARRPRHTLHTIRSAAPDYRETQESIVNVREVIAGFMDTVVDQAPRHQKPVRPNPLKEDSSGYDTDPLNGSPARRELWLPHNLIVPLLAQSALVAGRALIHRVRGNAQVNITLFTDDDRLCLPDTNNGYNQVKIASRRADGTLSAQFRLSARPALAGWLGGIGGCIVEAGLDIDRMDAGMWLTRTRHSVLRDGTDLLHIKHEDGLSGVLAEGEGQDGPPKITHPGFIVSMAEFAARVAEPGVMAEV
jgi:hypothetical protein